MSNTNTPDQYMINSDMLHTNAVPLSDHHVYINELILTLFFAIGIVLLAREAFLIFCSIRNTIRYEKYVKSKLTSERNK